MILFFSGGGRPWVPELCMDRPSVMLSFYTNTSAKTRKPDSRMRRMFKVRRRKAKVK